MLDHRLYAIAGGFIPLFTALAKEKGERLSAYDLSIDDEREMVHVYVNSNEAGMNLYVAITLDSVKVSIEERYNSQEIFTFSQGYLGASDLLHLIPQMVYQVAERERRTRFVEA